MCFGVFVHQTETQEEKEGKRSERVKKRGREESE